MPSRNSSSSPSHTPTVHFLFDFYQTATPMWSHCDLFRLRHLASQTHALVYFHGGAESRTWRTGPKVRVGATCVASCGKRRRIRGFTVDSDGCHGNQGDAIRKSSPSFHAAQHPVGDSGWPWRDLMFQKRRIGNPSQYSLPSDCHPHTYLTQYIL